MQARELESLTKALVKAVATKDTPQIITLLENLKNAGIPTEDMLRTTKAGLIVGKLRVNENPDISKPAGELVGRWRKAIGVEKVKRMPNGAAGQAQSQGQPAQPQQPLPSPQPRSHTSSVPPSSASAKHENAYHGDPLLRKHKTDGVNIQRTDSNTRNNCIGLLYDGLAYRSTESIMDVVSKAVACEAAVFAHFKGENDQYRAKIRSLFQNLKAKNNRELGIKVMTGVVTPQQLASFSTDQLKSSELKQIEKKLMEENIKNAQVATETRSISAELICGACNQRKVAYTQAQTRSADEPMTTFCECMHCGKRWKFS